MSGTGDRGRIVAAPTVERGLETCLRHFLPLCLADTCEQNGHERDWLPNPEGLVRLSEFRELPIGEQVAAVIVATPGTVGEARGEADSYTLVWDVRAAVLANLGDRLLSREAAQIYAAAAATAMTHHGVAVVGPDLKAWATDDDGNLLLLPGSSVRYVSETYRAVTEKGSGTLMAIAGEARVAVTVQGARAKWGGPDLPPPVDPSTGLPGNTPAVPGVSGPVVPDPVVERL